MDENSSKIRNNNNHSGSYALSPLKSDRPAQKDILGVGPYATAIAQLIFHEHSDPMVIGIQAPWGRGKSTFMGFIEQALASHTTATNIQEKIITVQFNAWQYEDSKQVWAGLASEISKQMEKSCSWVQRFFTPFLHAWQNFRTELFITVLMPFMGATMVGTGLFFAYKDHIFFTQRYSLLASMGSAVLMISFLTWRLFTKLTPVSKRILKYIRLPDYQSHMGYQNQVLSDLKFIYARLGEKNKNTKIVIFIDDLDRCSPDKIIEVLQAIHLILGNNNFFVILGIDTKMLHQAIESHYFKHITDHSITLKFAENYLNKIIHLPIYLPAVSKTGRFSLVKNMYGKDVQDQGPKIDSTFNFTAKDELDVYEKFQTYLGDNPRKIKKLVNVHRVIKTLLHYQDDKRILTTNQHRKLVIWLLFMTNWPELVEAVISYAGKEQDSRNCIRDLLDNDMKQENNIPGADVSHVKKFLTLVEGIDHIPSSDLLSGGYLESAARFFKLFRTDREINNPSDLTHKDQP